MIIRPEAEQDIAQASDWYDAQREGLGEEFEHAVDVCLRRIERMPEATRVVFQEVRRARISRFPYLVYYRIENGEVVILAVVHGHRGPEVWRTRA